MSIWRTHWRACPGFRCVFIGRAVWHGLCRHSDFTPDPAVLEEKRIFENPGNVSYHMTDTFLFYGLFRMKHAPVSLVMGPVAQVNPDRAAACEILRSMGEAPGRARELMEYMQSIPTYPLRNFLQILCTLNYFINDEKLNVKDLLTDEALPLIPGGETSSPAKQQYGFVHNTYELEQLLLLYCRTRTSGGSVSHDSIAAGGAGRDHG